jgi:ketosteroid isomerase-like protein
MTSAADKEAIERVKYRYLRALDTKDWEGFAATLTDDVTGDYGSRLHFTNRTELVEYMRSSIGPGVITEHRVTHPEITVEGDDAFAMWYLQDRVIAAESNFMLIGAAFYRDTYRRTPEGWKISATGYDRTYEATMSLEGLNFKLKPGPALHI